MALASLRRHGQSLPQLVCGDEGPSCSLQQQSLQGSTISPDICILLPQQIKALLQDSTQ
jgi:hypothetical protein